LVISVDENGIMLITTASDFTKEEVNRMVDGLKSFVKWPWRKPE